MCKGPGKRRFALASQRGFDYLTASCRVQQMPGAGGAVAQLGERRVRNAKVGSSILLGSTKSPTLNIPQVSMA